MRVLFATGSPAAYMAPPVLGTEQICCGPDWPDEKTPDGRWLSLRTPVGEYKLSAVAAKLPPEQKPDVVVCLVDASWRNLPRDLRAFNCPRVLLVADTHHLQAPLLGMLRYMTSEPFTRTVVLYDRHHAGFFRSAGVKNLFWFPGLTFPHRDDVVDRSRQKKRAEEIRFVGQVSRFHPRRTRLVESLRNASLPFAQKQLSQSDGLAFYGGGSVGFNASLNGDLNLRVFEILASGAALLTDRLAPAAGLEQILRPENYVAYQGFGDVHTLAHELMIRPERTAAIGAAGARWFDTYFREAHRRDAFAALAHEGREYAPFAFPSTESTRVFFAGNTQRLLQTLVVYETLQEFHRTEEAVSVGLSKTTPRELAEIFSTLPRIETHLSSPHTAADLDVVTKNDHDAIAESSQRLWFCDATAEDFTGLDREMEAEGFVRSAASNGIYRRCPRPVATDGKPHVLVYTDDPESGGVAQYNHRLILALVEAGHRVSCVQSRAENPLLTEQAKHGVTHHWIDYHTGREFPRTLSDASVAERVFFSDCPDLIIFSDCCPVSNLAAREIAMRFRIPYLVVVGFVGSYLAKNFAKYLPALARQYNRAREVVAVSEENLQLLRTEFQLSSSKGVVIHYGRPKVYFELPDGIARARLRAERKIPTDAIVSLTTARLTAVKGFAHQLGAIEQIARNPVLNALHFVWAGDGDQRAELEKEISRRKLSHRVHLLGHRWDAAAWYDAADIFVLTSHVEGMPLSIMEAMAKGLPVAASAVSGIPEELGDTGALLPDPSTKPSETVQTLVRVLTSWAQNPELRRTLGQKARARAQTLFREEQMLSKTLRLVGQSLPSSHEDTPATANAHSEDFHSNPVST